MNSCTVAYAFYETDFRIRRYAEVLHRKGDRTDAIALKTDSTKSFEILDGVNVHRIQSRDFDEQGGPFDYLLKMGTFFIKSSFLVLKNHLRYKYSLIIVHNVPDFFVFTAFIPKLLGAKVILDIHDILPEFFCQRFHKPLNSWQGKVLRIVEFLSVSFADFVITGNDLWRKKISTRDHKAFDRTIGFVNYPHLEYFKDIKYRVRNDQLSLIYPGHLSHHHGIDIAVNAMDIVRKTIPYAKLKIYAASWVPQYRSELEKLIAERKLHDVIEFFPPHDIHGLVEVYKMVDIGIVPKRGGFFASEAFSSKILDFMASGIPVIASKTTIDEFYFNDSQIMFFTPDSPESLAECIINLQGDSSRKKQLSENGLKFALDNNWDIKSKVFAQIANNLVKSNSDTAKD